MTRINELVDLLYFKGKVEDKHILLNKIYDKELDDNFSVIISIIL
jgi:hypothetical protein